MTDSGRGIPPAQLPHVFDRFWQAESAARQNKGLRLAIAKQRVELHGGTIDGDSPGAGRGTTFRVRLPLPAPTARPAARPRSRS